MTRPVLVINPADKNKEEIICLLVSRFIEATIKGEESCVVPVLSCAEEEVIGVAAIRRWLWKIPPGVP